MIQVTPQMEIWMAVEAVNFRRSVGGAVSGDDDLLGEPDGETGGDDGVGYMGQVICIYPYVPSQHALGNQNTLNRRTIVSKDISLLKEMGVKEVFPVGSTFDEIVAAIKRITSKP
jgi:hypothetical protein